METTKKSTTPVIVPKPILKGKDGREPFADKIAKAKETLERYGLPEEIKRREPFAEKLEKVNKILKKGGLPEELKKT